MAPTVVEPLRTVLTVEQLWHTVPGGSGTYVRELTRALLARDDVAPTGLVARHDGPPMAAWAPEAHLPLAASRLPRRALYAAWDRLHRPRSARLAGPADVLHATTWAIPPASAPLVVTVHDLAFLRSSEHFTPHGAAYFRRALETTRREARAVIAVSEATRDDCVRAGLDGDRVHVVPQGVRVPTVTADAVEAFCRARGLTRPYVFWCGTVEPRKNVPAVLRAFARLVDAGADLDLVLAGPTGWGDAAAAVERLHATAPPGRLHALGPLDPADLHAAYAGARAFVFPSFWEGFGLPVLEAMAHGIPVVTSVDTSMAEMTGGAGLLVDPLDDAALAEALGEATGPQHDQLATAAPTQAARYTWEACAAATVEVYRSVL